MARGGAPAGPRNQESADADPAVAPSGCGGILPAPAGARALVEECTATIVGEVESLKGLVDEFSQFARMPSPRTVPTDLAQLIADTLALYDGIFSRRRASTSGSRQACRSSGSTRSRSAASIINLVDNAIEAMERRGRIVVETQLDDGQPRGSRHRGRRRPGHSAGANARSCSCRTTRPSAAAAASGWPSCAASSPSTAAASKSARTRRAAPASRSSCRADSPTDSLIVDDEPGVRDGARRRAAGRRLHASRPWRAARSAWSA